MILSSLKMPVFPQLVTSLFSCHKYSGVIYNALFNKILLLI